MRTFERRKANVLWIWDIDLSGRQLTILHGKRGQRLQIVRVELADAARAEKECDKRIRDKVREGYLETTPANSIKPANVREALEMSLAEQPDDIGTHMAYADHLLEQGDPRGEFIQLQLALEDGSLSPQQRQKLQQREHHLLLAHWRQWLGALGPLLGEQAEPPPRLRFVRGWLDTLVLPILTVELARALVRVPQVRLLRSLIIYGCKWERTGSKPEADDLPRYQPYPATYVLARSALLRNVCSLQIGGPMAQPPQARYPRSGTALLELLPRLFRLEELSLFLDGLTGEELFTTSVPPTLRALWVDGVRVNDQALSLARSGLLEQLKVLRLYNSGLDDVGAGNLARRLPQPQLELLDLSHNRLTFAGIETLRAAGAHLIAENQAVVSPPRPQYDDGDDYTTVEAL
jgi:uncharacterized protein (TIGR02996 family)